MKKSHFEQLLQRELKKALIEEGDKLKEQDDRTTERVAAELDAEIEIPCSLEQDMEWANESENIQ